MGWRLRFFVLKNDPKILYIMKSQDRYLLSSVVDPDLVGTASFCRIRIGIQNQVVSENLEELSGALQYH